MRRMITFTASVRYTGAGRPHSILAEIAEDLSGCPWNVDETDLERGRDQSLESAAVEHVRMHWLQMIDDAGHPADPKLWAISVEI